LYRYTLSLPPRPEAPSPLFEPAPLHRRPRPLIRDQREHLIADYQAGATIYDLARRYGIHRHTVGKHLADAGVQARRHGLSTDELATARHLYAQGQSLARIGDQLGYDHGTIRRALLRAGVPMRDTHGRER
jgi:DNA-binding CsgD family transcriptional regulator